MIRIFFVLVLLGIAAGCSNSSHRNALNDSQDYYNYIQPSFADYLKETRAWLTANRGYVTSDHEKEISMNMPFELMPEMPTDKAVLLVHGLGDSPYSYSDLAVTLKEQGFYVQTLLLPGHGSKPEDLMLPRYQDWQEIVDHYTNLLKQKYDQVWLGGFSTGGNLVTIHAIEQGGVDGLILVSPGLQSKAPILEKFAPLAALFFDGYTEEETNLARYNSAPLNGAIAYSDSASRVRSLLKTKTVTIPTLVVISEADSIIDPVAVRDLYSERFDNPNNRLIWYGESEQDSSSIEVLTMHLYNHKISTGSHMSPIFAPSNAYYGENGEKRMCMNSFSDEATMRCNNGEEVWFSAWGYEEEGKIHARLTWNPYYAELEQSIRRITLSDKYTTIKQ
ncbi:alpha/beta hydrolase [Vibrio sp. HN007]|uniref:alpha/beta hydrolase n=1 Tax=Vibrio iocasae TaxID=3098914 RepID=UPI0035D44EBA